MLYIQLKSILASTSLILLLSACSSSCNDSFSSPESSWIRSATFECDNGTLIIEMNKQEYTFKGVPNDVWEGFKNASSKGEYYHTHIRGDYPL